MGMDGIEATRQLSAMTGSVDAKDTAKIWHNVYNSDKVSFSTYLQF